MKSALATLFFLVCSFSVGAQEGPDLEELSKAGFIIAQGPGSNLESYEVNRAWVDYVEVMSKLKIYDGIVDRMVEVFCSEDQNRSVLLVGEASDAYRYIFARLSNIEKPEGCAADWHVEVDINKIEAGHSYVGEVAEYWEESILKPSDRKNVILYFRSLWNLIGMGSSSNDATGVETEYSANILAGRIKTVAFVNKFEYERIRNSENSYVVNSFAEKINLKALEEDEMKKMVDTYIGVLYPRLSLSKDNRKFLLKTLARYQPNVNEPERTMNVLKSLLRKIKIEDVVTEILLEAPIETPHNYPPNANLEFSINKPDVDGLVLSFDAFETEQALDLLKVYNAETGKLLAEYSGALGAFETRVFKTSNIRLVFTSDSSAEQAGFVITKIKGVTGVDHIIKRKEVRAAIFSFLQVPEWIVDRKFKRIKDLADFLERDVIGADQGRAAVVREAKVGYVVGRTTKKPVANLLLAGPTGTGKSHLAKATADALDMRVVTFDMTGYQTGASFERFVEIMSRNLTLYPFAVYLFEEIDKANPAILDQLFFLMDDGLFYDKFQRPLSARGAFIFMTTNAGHEVILENPDHPDIDRLANKALQQVFRLSFLNRFNDVVISKPFTLDQYRQMSRALYIKKSKKVKTRFGWKLEMDEESLEFIAVHGQSSIYGSRPIERLMENILIGAIAEFQLEYGEISSGSKISLAKKDGDNFKFIITVEDVALEFETDLRINDGFGFMSVDDELFFKRLAPGVRVPYRDLR